ncbi:phytanoyl-CoA dioxygenase family protein [Massilia glaciei]|uniref:Phytanoyl-CoA dioxygenase n=1 Tax=Massilia glaciei TaxID=1524097 RepID=A0A2U2HPJ5_9BURK|nr:phytanoyl-CoA dioxygenase family protein [Massilia glaciei]PWF49345.1 phytanoyl-CoA dioxygenase [Massilia glaciei]
MHAFDRDGFALLPDILSGEACARLAAQVTPAAGGSGGTRALLSTPWCAELARMLRRHRALAPYIPAGHVAVQCTYFEKTAARNWLVPFHQDLSIPVAARVDDPALRGWSRKEEVQFVQAPPAVLAQMLTVRLHLDDCGSDDGPLRVLAGSHRQGVIDDAGAAALRATRDALACTAARGSALVLRPLLLHASSKSRGDSRRRVLHLVFGPPALPHGLDWHCAL